MSHIVKTYSFVVFVTFSLFLIGCGAESMDQEMAGDNYEDNKQMVEATKSEEAASEASFEESESSKIGIDLNKWENKAKQQLESVQDLVLILKDPSLDIDFRFEIEKELTKLYANIDSSAFDLNSHELNFKKFKDLNIESGDTLTILFKNKKEQLKARFIIVNEIKYFGESSEVVEQLKLLSIKKEL